MAHPTCLGDISITSTTLRARRWLTALALPLLLAAPALLASGLAWLLARLTDAEVPGHAEPWPARLAVYSTALAGSGLAARWLSARLGPARLMLAVWGALTVSPPCSPSSRLPPASAFCRPCSSPPPAPGYFATCPSRQRLVPHRRPPVPDLAGADVVAGGRARRGHLRPRPHRSRRARPAVRAARPLWPTRRASSPLSSSSSPCSPSSAPRSPSPPRLQPDRPRRLSLVFHQDADTDTARWLIDGAQALPPTLAATGSFTRAPAFAWTPDDEPSWISTATPIAVPAPELTVEPPRTSPARGVGTCACACVHREGPAAPRSSSPTAPSCAGWRSPARPSRPTPSIAAAGTSTSAITPSSPLPPEGVLVELVVRSSEPVILTVLDVSDDLPPAGAELVDARPAWAIPTHGGDRSTYSRSFAY